MSHVSSPWADRHEMSWVLQKWAIYSNDTWTTANRRGGKDHAHIWIAPIHKTNAQCRSKPIKIMALIHILAMTNEAFSRHFLGWIACFQTGDSPRSHFGSYLFFFCCSQQSGRGLWHKVHVSWAHRHKMTSRSNSGKYQTSILEWRGK